MQQGGGSQQVSQWYSGSWRCTPLSGRQDVRQGQMSGRSSWSLPWAFSQLRVVLTTSSANEGSLRARETDQRTKPDFDSPYGCCRRYWAQLALSKPSQRYSCVIRG